MSPFLNIGRTTLVILCTLKLIKRHNAVVCFVKRFPAICAELACTRTGVLNLFNTAAKKLEMLLLWPEVSSLHFHSPPNLTKLFPNYRSMPKKRLHFESIFNILILTPKK